MIKLFKSKSKIFQNLFKYILILLAFKFDYSYCLLSHDNNNTFQNIVYNNNNNKENKIYINLEKLISDINTIIEYSNSRLNHKNNILNYNEMYNFINSFIIYINDLFENFASQNRKYTCQTNLIILNQALQIHNYTATKPYEIIDIETLQKEHKLPNDLICPSNGKYIIFYEYDKNMSDTSTRRYTHKILCTVHSSLDNIKDEPSKLLKHIQILPTDILSFKNIIGNQKSSKKSTYFDPKKLYIKFVNFPPTEVFIQIIGKFSIIETSKIINSVILELFSIKPRIINQNSKIVESIISFDRYLPNGLLYTKVCNNFIELSLLDQQNFALLRKLTQNYSNFAKSSNAIKKSSIFYLNIEDPKIVRSILNLVNLKFNFENEVNKFEVNVNKSNLEAVITLVSNRDSKVYTQSIINKIRDLAMYIKDGSILQNEKKYSNSILLLNRLGIALDSTGKKIYIYLEKLDINLIWLFESLAEIIKFCHN